MEEAKFPNPEWLHKQALQMVVSFGLDPDDQDLVRIATRHVEAAFRDLVTKGRRADHTDHDYESDVWALFNRER